jgi:5-formaminoimidazole-4-carboxamide-1-beta-D-ribofuranosyl 5'-monophosphate synthetase
MNRFIAAVAACLLLSACTALTDRDARLRLAVSYATGKLIEQSSSITGPGVIGAVQNARAIVETDELVTVIDISAQIRAALNLDELGPADRMLVDALLLEVEREFEIRLGTGFIGHDDKLAILTFLDWVEFAALMYR